MNRILLLLLLLTCAIRLAGQTLPPIPERIISIDCENKRTDEVLQEIAAKGGFEFAWDGSLFDPAKPVTIHAHNITVRRAVYLLFGNSITFRVKGNYLILQAAPAPLAAGEEPPKKKEYAVSGYITDASGGTAIPHATVYDPLSLSSALSDEYGHYTLRMNAGSKPVRLNVSRENYCDTFFIYTPVSNASQDISLRRFAPPVSLPVKKVGGNDSLLPIDSSLALTEQQHRRWKEYRLARFPLFDSLAGYQIAMNARNLKEELRRNGQVSLLPFVSTNAKMSGSVVNKFSLNIIGGYSGGTNGIEIGGGFNIDRGDVYGVQLAGGFNVVGGTFYGIQTAGGANFCAGTFTGIQLTNGANILLDTLHGFQVSGGCNFIRGYVDGMQIAGGCNFAANDLDGIQLAGGSNFTLGDVKKAQISGGVNYAHSVEGVQIGSAVNFSLEQMTGLQVAGAVNYAGDVKGVQVAGLLNRSEDSLSGLQLAPLNFARTVRGAQFGVFNFADTCSNGTIIGLLSVVRHGLHEIEIAGTEKGFASFSFHTGVHNFYNTIIAGLQLHQGAVRTWTVGYGIGHRFLLRPHLNLALDLSVQHVNRNSVSLFTNEWGQLALTAEWRIVRKLALAAGPVVNYYYTGSSSDDLATIHQKPLIDRTGPEGYRSIGWIGATVSIRFF